jgi:hypothetical protein
MKQRQPKQRSKRPRPSCEEGELRDEDLEKLPDRRFQESDFLEAVRKAAATRRRWCADGCIDSCFEHAQACAETCRCCESACNNLLFAVGVQTLPLKPSSG